jgi:hypothetical protein
MESEMRDMLTAVLEGLQFLGAKLEAHSVDTAAQFEASAAATKGMIAALSAEAKAQFEAAAAATKGMIAALSAEAKAQFEASATDTKGMIAALSMQMEASAGDTHARLDVLTENVATVKEELTEVNERLRYLTLKTAVLEQDMFLVKQKPRA